VNDQKTFVVVDELTSDEDIDARRAGLGAAARVDCFIALIESPASMRERIRCSLQSALSLPVVTYSTVSELERRPDDDASADLVMLSLADASTEACAAALKALSELFPGIPIIVLARENDVDLARTAMSRGAKGYFPCTTGFEIAVEAVRFVLAGGADGLSVRNKLARPCQSREQVSSVPELSGTTGVRPHGPVVTTSLDSGRPPARGGPSDG
jgi:DNA-binding NarL/FixJ family response regulator